MTQPSDSQWSEESQWSFGPWEEDKSQSHESQPHESQSDEVQLNESQPRESQQNQSQHASHLMRLDASGEMPVIDTHHVLQKHQRDSVNVVAAGDHGALLLRLLDKTTDFAGRHLIGRIAPLAGAPRPVWMEYLLSMGHSRIDILSNTANYILEFYHVGFNLKGEEPFLAVQCKLGEGDALTRIKKHAKAAEKAHLAIQVTFIRARIVACGTTSEIPLKCILFYGNSCATTNPVTHLNVYKIARSELGIKDEHTIEHGPCAPTPLSSRTRRLPTHAAHSPLCAFAGSQSPFLSDYADRETGTFYNLVSWKEIGCVLSKHASERRAGLRRRDPRPRSEFDRVYLQLL